MKCWSIFSSLDFLSWLPVLAGTRMWLKRLYITRRKKSNQPPKPIEDRNLSMQWLRHTVSTRSRPFFLIAPLKNLIGSHYPVLLDFGYFKLNWIVILLKIISYYPIKNIRNWQPLRYSNLTSPSPKRQNKRVKKNDKTDHFGPVIERLTNTWNALLPPVKEKDLL